MNLYTPSTHTAQLSLESQVDIGDIQELKDVYQPRAIAVGMCSECKLTERSDDLVVFADRCSLELGVLPAIRIPTTPLLRLRLRLPSCPVPCACGIPEEHGRTLAGVLVRH